MLLPSHILVWPISHRWMPYLQDIKRFIGNKSGYCESNEFQILDCFIQDWRWEQGVTGNFHPWKFSEKCLSKIKCHTNTSIHLNHKVTHSLLAEEFKIIKKNNIITCNLYLSCNYQNRNYLIRPWTILISNNIHWKIKSYTVKLLIREDNI